MGVAYDGWEGRGSNAPAESSYPAASAIVSFDIYPFNNCGGDTNEQVTCGQFWLNASGVDRLHQWSTRHQAVWIDIETTVINANTTTGPTPAETASEAWLSLIHEANGIVCFLDTWNPSFQEGGIFKSSTMVTAVTALDKQIQALALRHSGRREPHDRRRRREVHRHVRRERGAHLQDRSGRRDVQLSDRSELHVTLLPSHPTTPRGRARRRRRAAHEPCRDRRRRPPRASDRPADG